MLLTTQEVFKFNTIDEYFYWVRQVANYHYALIQSKGEAHYTYRYDNGAYAKELLEGDVHNKNTQIFFPRETGIVTGKQLPWTLRRRRSRSIYNAWFVSDEGLIGLIFPTFKTSFRSGGYFMKIHFGTKKVQKMGRVS